MKRADTGPSVTGQAPVPGRATRRARALAVAGLAAVLAGALTGCSTRSPATIITPYAASDGVNVNVGGDVVLRDMLVVGTEKGGQGAVVGTVVNLGERTTTVELSAQLGENTPFGQTRVSVPPSGRVLIAPGERYEMIISDLPVGPGETLEMSAAAANAGATYFKAPVLTAEGQYASYTVAPVTPTGSPSTDPEASEPAGGTGAGQSSAEPTDTPDPSDPAGGTGAGQSSAVPTDEATP